MNSYHQGQKLPTLKFEVKSMAVIAGTIAVLDFFPALIEREYAMSVGHEHIFMNTPLLLTLMDRYVLDWSGPAARIKSHGLVMRKPVYAGTTVDIDGTVTAIRPFAGSSLAGSGTEVEVALSITHEGEQRTKGSVTIVLPK